MWGDDFGPASNSLEVYVGYLRRKMEAGGEPRLIHTVRGVGYVLREPCPCRRASPCSGLMSLAVPGRCCHAVIYVVVRNQELGSRPPFVLSDRRDAISATPAPPENPSIRPAP